MAAGAEVDVVGAVAAGAGAVGVLVVAIVVADEAEADPELVEELVASSP